MSGPLMKRPDVSAAKVAIASAATPVNLGVLGSSILGTVGLIVAGKPIIGVAVLILGVLAYGALIGLDLFNPKFLSKVYEIPDANRELDAAEGAELAADLDRIEVVELQTLFRHIVAKYEGVRHTVHASGGLLQSSLRETLDSCAELVREAGRVARRGNPLYRYMNQVHPNLLRAEAETLIKQAERTRDETAAKTFRQAADAKRQQLDTREQIEGLYDRIKAQLHVIETALDGIEAKVVKLNASDVQEAARVGASISHQVDSLSNDMQALETTVTEIVKELQI